MQFMNRIRVIRWVKLVAATSFLFCFSKLGFAQNLTKLTGRDSSCVSEETAFLSVWKFPMKGEKVSESPEMSQQLASMIPCLAFSKVEMIEVQNSLQAASERGLSVHEALDSLIVTQKVDNAKRRVFGIVNEYYDNLSFYLIELQSGKNPKYIKLIMKRDQWTQAMEKLRPQLEKLEGRFLDSWDGNQKNYRLSVQFEKHSNNESLHRLEEEINSSLRSRFRNPLPPKSWERRSFFELARENEPSDAMVQATLEMNGTKIYARVAVSQNTSNSRTAWLEGSLASLPEFEEELYGAVRDMLSDVMKIYDYSVNFGIEFYKTKHNSGRLYSASARHNRGDLSATARLQIGQLSLTETCGEDPLILGLSLLPGWQFYQTERGSFDGGVLLGAGAMDIKFKETSEAICSDKTGTSTYLQLQSGIFLQGNYTAANRFSILGRTSYEFSGISNFSNSRNNETMRIRYGPLFFLGLGWAL
jgi:hypothetical protein